MTTITAFTATRAGLHAPGYDRGGDWREQAECRDVDPAVFEQDDRRTPTESDWAHARTICAACPVRDLCLEDALSVEARGSRFGMRGGATPEERQSIYRARGRAGRAA
ncbi:MAG TPA: WhiB family transcriptional regulator [Friedmanniella sp.]